MTKKVRSVHSLAIQRQPMRKPVATPRGGSHRDGATGYAYDGHRGIDYAVPSNTPVVAADDGTIIYSEWSDSGGWGVVMDHAYDRTAYFHNNQLFVYPGQHVSRGQLIALSGTTGNSTGPHVHFEVRDLMTPWHSVDPYGWTGPGPDPWRWDMGNLWANGTPVPFLLPLAFPGGARWNFWYGNDGPPPPVSWHLRDGGHGLAGFAAQWDQDPGMGAPRTQATSGSAAVPGPGSHTLHLRVFDRAGTSVDITYLYLYDVDPPTSALNVDPALGSALNLHWSGHDQLSGVKDAAFEVGAGGLAFRPWFTQRADQPLAGKTLGAVRFFGDAGTTYQFRLTVRDAARNAAPPVVLNESVPAGAGPAPSAADRAILGPLPAQTDGTVIAVDAAGAIAGSGTSVAAALPAGTTVVDAALFPGTHSGLALDSSGAVHAFGGADAALAALPTMWTLPGQPAAMTLAGTAQAPAGILTDASGDWQAFGSMLLLPDASFAGPAFDAMTGLPV